MTPEDGKRKGMGAWGFLRAGRRRFPFRKRSALLLLLPGAVLFWACLPDPLFRTPYSAVALARDGRLLGARIAADGQWRFPAAPCPPRFAAAAMAYEDGRFRMHPGVDPLAVLRAAFHNVRSGKVVSGASTLTMQVIRLSRPGRPRTLSEKAVEAVLALRLELSSGKDGILSLYAAQAPFGGNVVGLPAAAWRYFGRGPESLSWGEAALLAVLPNSPSLMHPGRNREPLRRKRDRLLRRLRDGGHIDSLTAALASLEPLPEKPLPLPREAPHLLQRLAEAHPAFDPGSDGLPTTRSTPAPGIYRTTLDADLQRQVNGILARHRSAWEGAGIHNAAVLILDTRTGEALAYAGNIPPPEAQPNPSPINRFHEGESPQPAEAGEESRREKSSLAPGALEDFSVNTREDFSVNNQDVDIIAAPRSTGSLLKPFLYAAMLEAGEILPGTLVPDIPTVIGGYSAENFDRGYEGAVPARMALARSLNVPAVRMLRDYGIGRFLHVLRGLGLTTLTRSADDYGLTLVLGGAEGSLWELTGLYAGLAREAGRYAVPAPDNEIRPAFFPPRACAADAGRDDFGEAPATRPEEDPGAHPNTLIGPASAWLALQAMAEVSRPDAEQHWRHFASSRWVAWKTGTSFGFRDAWAVGVTPEFTVGVWVGNASGQGRPGMTGIQAAAPVLFEAFNLLPPSSAFPRPMASLRRIAVCPQSGMRPSPHCPPGMAADSAWIPEAGLRTAACPYHRLVHLDAEGRYQVHDGCEGVAGMVHRPWFTLPPSQEWFYRQRHADYRPAPPWRRDCEEGTLAGGRPRAMDLLYPRGTAGIYVPVDLDARKGRAVFEAVHRDPSATVFWHLDQGYLGQTREFHKWPVDPGPGKHTLLLVDDKGERLEQAFEVLAREAAEER